MFGNVMEQPPPSKRKGGWIGIDLGTSNCTAAVWDLDRSRCKVLRLGYKNLARPPSDGSSSGKGGKIVPSAVLFDDDDDAKVGYDATSQLEKCNNVDMSAALVTSFKRVVGMTSNQARELQLSDGEFWDSLPFHAVILNEEDSKKEPTAKQQSNQLEVNANDVAYDVLGDIDTGTHTQSLSANENSLKTNKKEGVAIRIRPLNSATERLVTPLDVTSSLLQSIRIAANEYLQGKNRSKILAPGMSSSESNAQPLIENCVIGVPAHYSLAQRTSIQMAAKEAGFSGYIGVMTESTAAAMSYGLFVTPTSSSDYKGKIILVFDMGGGTTDVTIAKMETGNNSDAVQFRVLSTAGDRCLGGDNVDELLARYVWKRLVSSEADSSWKASDHQELVRHCRRAKEELCGDGDIDSVPADSAVIAYQGKEMHITRTEFDQAIEHLVDRAEHVVDDALLALEAQEPTSKVHEVVLVGGSTHIPTIRSMLSRKFPPPFVPELCTSISAETAVSQGLAIQAALLSGLVPLYELRNAMMLDTMPHSIGVWVCGPNSTKESPYEKGDFIHAGDRDAGHFVPILEKDTTLPAKGTTTFELANVSQNGVSIVAVENIAKDQYQCMGVFNFLLHHLEYCGNTRKVEVGMVLKESGQFIVSIFDELDPEHRAKGRKYLESQGLIDSENPEEENQGSISGNEIGLILLCVAFFALYVTVKVLFNEIDLDNEL